MELDTLTPYALRELVKAIYIEAPDKSSGKRRQGIHIATSLDLSPCQNWKKRRRHNP